MTTKSMSSQHPDFPNTLNMVVEVSKGSLNQYTYDRKSKTMKLERVITPRARVPGDYGFIPDTKNPAGEPFEALMLVTSPVLPKTVVEARPVGALAVQEGDKLSPKILCVPSGDAFLEKVKDIQQVPRTMRDAVASFFTEMKKADGKRPRIGKWYTAKAALEALQQPKAKASKKKKQ